LAAHQTARPAGRCWGQQGQNCDPFSIMRRQLRWELRGKTDRVLGYQVTGAPRKVIAVTKWQPVQRPRRRSGGGDHGHHSRDQRRRQPDRFPGR
jgi:hypothetical protein